MTTPTEPRTMPSDIGYQWGPRLGLSCLGRIVGWPLALAGRLIRRLRGRPPLENTIDGYRAWLHSWDDQPPAPHRWRHVLRGMRR